ncbi:hypothetical protein BURMUCF2_0136 [Burkholderia multivorans CF2]|nr:hypothetical protein BURMUCF2_0136 [Burkholderia multivorans CF2]
MATSECNPGATICIDRNGADAVESGRAVCVLRSGGRVRQTSQRSTSLIERRHRYDAAGRLS